jgi:peroxiredoxin
MNELYEEFKGRGFTLLLVNTREDPQLVGKAVRARGYTAPVVLDPDGAVTAAYRVTGTPTVYLVDRASQIVGRAIGRRDWASETGRRLIGALVSR